MPVGVHDRALADAAVLPLALAGHEVDADEEAVADAVQVAVDEHDAADVDLHLVGVVDLCRRRTCRRRRRRDLEQVAADVVAGGDEDVVVGVDRRGDDGGLALAPACQSTSPFSASTPATLSPVSWMYVRLPPMSAGTIDEYAAESVKSLLRQSVLPVVLSRATSVPVLAAGRADELVAVDQRRLGVAPAAHHLAVEVLLEVLAPDFLAVLGFDADEVAELAERVDAVAVDGRRGARARDSPPPPPTLPTFADQTILPVCSSSAWT